MDAYATSTTGEIDGGYDLYKPSMWMRQFPFDSNNPPQPPRQEQSMMNFDFLDSYPELLSSEDLCEIGLFNSLDAIYQARLRGRAPDYIKFQRRILYPKEAVIAFMQKYLRKGDTNLAPSSEEQEK